MGNYSLPINASPNKELFLKSCQKICISLYKERIMTNLSLFWILRIALILKNHHVIEQIIDYLGKFIVTIHAEKQFNKIWNPLKFYKIRKGNLKW